MDNITGVSVNYIFADGERIKANPENLKEALEIAISRHALYEKMYKESNKIIAEHKAKVDKMPFHTEEEIKGLHNAMAAIPLELDNKYRNEAVCEWSGMCKIARTFFNNMEHWRNIYRQVLEVRKMKINE